MKKKLLGVLLSGIMILGLAACGEKADEGPANEEVNVPVEEIGDKILEELEYGSMIELDDETLKQFYELDASILEEYDANIPMMNVTTQEYSVFKVKDAKDAETVKNAIDKRAAAVQKSFEQYLPDQYENAKNYYVEVNGKYIVFVIHTDVEKAKEIFQGYFK
ncbi:DUF4358 domain-containing protein [Proteiniclasticum sp.]|uniref:DUF4358 domain-containing protein n=1 Tax=Proteiniclasticum sp. TaxID=2053595 RepID=UPI002898EDE6|nr:DUF4358 domain-containing protein [Proteiniclasticum sp.]